MKISIELVLTEEDLSRLCCGEKSNFIYHLVNKKVGEGELDYEEDSGRIMVAVLQYFKNNCPEIIRDMEEFERIVNWLVAMPYACLRGEKVLNQEQRKENIRKNKNIMWAIESPPLEEFPLKADDLIKETFSKLERKAELEKKRGIEDADEQCNLYKEFYKGMIQEMH